jgi:hypothetical protein
MEHEVAAPSSHRRNGRQDVSIAMQVILPGRPPLILRTGNASAEGIFLRCASRSLPAVGTELIVTMDEFLESTEPMAMRARVVHRNDIGFGIEFIGPIE